MSAENTKLLLLDSNSLMYRAFHALPLLTDDKGRNTGAIFGFLNMLTGLINEEKPTHIAAAFDLKAPTFRHKMYDGYKATRSPMPPELVEQMPVIKQMLAAMKITVVEKEGYEADDVLGTLSKKFDVPTVIVTGDRDSLQLVSPTTSVYLTKKGIKDVVVYTPERLLEDGFTPASFIDYKALRGDVSDNIPGIPGVGEVTAKNLLKEYGSLDEILKNAENVKGKLGEKIAAGKESAILSKELATIALDAPIGVTLDDLKFDYPLSAEFRQMLSDYKLESTAKRLQFVAEAEVKKVKTDVKTIDIGNLADLEKAVEKVSGKTVAIVLSDKLNFSVGDGTEYSVAEKVDLFGGLSYDDIVFEAKKMACSDCRKIVFDYKTLLHKFDFEEAAFKGQTDDVMILAHLVKGGKSITKPEQAFDAFGYAGEYPATELLELYSELEKSANELGVKRLYDEVELPLVSVLYKMERTGFTVDKEFLLSLGEKYSNELSELTAEIFRLTGESFNVNSPKQLAYVLFDKLGLPKGRKASTNVEVLNGLRSKHPVVPLILRYREIGKLKSTYVDGMVKLIGSNQKLHTEFKQTVTSTGRLSSTEPNLQNIPTRKTEGKEIRRAFVASEGNVLVCADYSQIELRLLAHFSGDENLIKSYCSGVDVHAVTAAEIFGVPLDEVTKEMRGNAKAVNFGIIYGISDWGLANDLSISPKRAKEFIEKYLATYPKVKEYMDANVAYAKEHGYVKTFMGRIRFLPEVTASNAALRSFGERAAMNMPLQGSSADIIKMAMLRLDKSLEGMKSKLILQVHDELIVDTVPEEEERVKALLRDAMENAVSFKVPLSVNVESGKNWVEAK